MAKKLLAIVLAMALMSVGITAASAERAAFPAVSAQAEDGPEADAPEEAWAEAEPEAAPRFYTDVGEELWCYPYIRALFDLGVLPEAETFAPEDVCTRLEFVRYLYRLYLAAGGVEAAAQDAPAFSDVPADGEGHAAAVWARQFGITYGVSETEFDPDSPVNREQCCVFLVRFAYVWGIPLAKVSEPALFLDSDRVSEFARNDVVVCQMAGLMAGRGGGTFDPDAGITRQETAAVLCRLYQAVRRGAATEPGVDYVSLSPGAYLSCYDALSDTFGDPVPESAAVSADWFRDAAFIGDSVTVRLQMYCASTGALDGATFLCTTSLSAPNALSAVTSKSLHPTYNGVKMTVEDAVAACGAKNVYIMLGINNMYSPIDQSTASLVTLVGKIKEKSPNANVIIQSVTPLSASSSILSGTMNNPKIDQYNEKMREYCAQYGWYYLDVASQFKDENGNLIAGYCSDPQSMGIHFTNAGAQVWMNYLLTHVPEALK